MLAGLVIILFSLANAKAYDDQLISILKVLNAGLNPATSQLSGELSQSVDDVIGQINKEDLYLVELEDEYGAEKVALSGGFRLVRQLRSYPNVYVAERLPRRKREASRLDSKLRWAEHVEPFIREKRRSFGDFRLPYADSAPLPEDDVMSVGAAWSLGFNGTGVTVAILDDGIDYTHPGLSHSYIRELSFDFTKGSQDAMPESGEDSRHGTNCAGLIAMKESMCGVGVAPGAKIAGLKLLGENEINDIIEGEALIHHHKEVSIYSVSWGPRDDGSTAERPSKLATRALETGARKGRNGLGSLYIWASGNGGLYGDDCAMDGYASNRYTMSFGVVDESGRPAYFTEGCSAVLAAVRPVKTKIGGIMTTDVGGGCIRLSGTSAAAPLASAIMALLLQANPQLTARDVQHLIVHTSKSANLVEANPEEWQKNGAGHYFNRHLGFGVLDAAELIKWGQKWSRVEDEKSCSREVTVTQGDFDSEHPFELTIPFGGCVGTSAEVQFVEKVDVEITMDAGRRGDLQIELVSPQGSRVELLRARPHDSATEGLQGWSFVSAHNWGEKSVGDWTIRIKTIRSYANVRNLLLTVHGTNDSVKTTNGKLFQK